MSINTKIMDVTLRDGSYAVDFQFSEYETENVCRELFEAGMDYIEIGHGMGLNASSPINGEALCSDEEYLDVARKVVPEAKYGMFCIPGIAEIDSLDKMKEYGASFVRVGTNVTEVSKSEKYIKHAKEIGLEVMANYMKSYVVKPEVFAMNVLKSEEYGADLVYVVDSAGNMDNKAIYDYFEAIRKKSSIRLGFHGHNNLGLAVSNSLYAMELGFDLVDTSLLGIGRSAGNAPTELLVGNITKKQNESKYDLKVLLHCAELYVRPLWNHTPNALDLYSGIAGFHTSYMRYIHKYAVKYRVNPLELIVKYCEYDQINLDEKMMEQIASSMPKDDKCFYTNYGFNEYIGDEQNG